MIWITFIFLCHNKANQRKNGFGATLIACGGLGSPLSSSWFGKYIGTGNLILWTSSPCRSDRTSDPRPTIPINIFPAPFASISCDAVIATSNSTICALRPVSVPLMMPAGASKVSLGLIIAPVSLACFWAKITPSIIYFKVSATKSLSSIFILPLSSCSRSLHHLPRQPIMPFNPTSSSTPVPLFQRTFSPYSTTHASTFAALDQTRLLQNRSAL